MSDVKKMPEPEGRVTAKTEDPPKGGVPEQNAHPITGNPLEPGQGVPNITDHTLLLALGDPGLTEAEPPPPWPTPDTPPDEEPPYVEGADYRSVTVPYLPGGSMSVIDEEPVEPVDPPVSKSPKKKG